jgi:hypothetical protein
MKTYFKWKAELDKQIQISFGVCLSEICNNDERLRGMFDNGLSVLGAAKILFIKR